MKRILICLLALLLLAGCGNKTEDTTPVEKDLAAIYAQMEPQLPEMMKLSDSMMLDLLGIKAEFCAEAMVYICGDGLRVDEVWLIEAADADSLHTLQTLAQNRLESQKDIYQSYAPDQYAILEQGVIRTAGNYLAFVVSENAGQLVDLFSK